jgi:hypothetical protein
VSFWNILFSDVLNKADVYMEEEIEPDLQDDSEVTDSNADQDAEQ